MAQDSCRSVCCALNQLEFMFLSLLYLLSLSLSLSLSLPLRHTPSHTPISSPPVPTAALSWQATGISSAVGPRLRNRFNIAENDPPPCHAPLSLPPQFHVLTPHPALSDYHLLVLSLFPTVSLTSFQTPFSPVFFFPCHQAFHFLTLLSFPCHSFPQSTCIEFNDMAKIISASTCLSLSL